MTELPTGTVTFLFSDIEGSTRLLRTLGARYRDVQDRHAEIMRRAIMASRGHEIRTEGDSFFVVFRTATDAVAAVVSAQRALAAHEWPADGEVRVRMGLHTGEGVAGGDDYIGIDVNKAARIAAAGHGGQILLSETTRSLVADALPEAVRVRNLGSYRLKDLPTAERLHQLEISGMRAQFPPVRALDVRGAHLPRESTTFIGRGGELRVLTAIVPERRLVTLTGPGGSGKTRLALRTAAAVVDRFPDGAYFVGLAAIRDVGLLPAAVASALNVSDCGTSTLEPCETPLACAAVSSCEQTVADWLCDREVLLVLDNLEQIKAAGCVIERLLSASPGLRVLATSRAPLHVSGEQEFPVKPLAVPAHDAGPDALEASDAVRLFIDRARLIDPVFSPTPDDIAAIADICRSLDGLPLAIELTAARVRLLSLAALRQRLGRRLDAFVGGPEIPQRQHSLRDAIAWSHDLLDDPGKAMFRRLAVFVGGWTIDAAAEICAGSPVRDIEAELEALAEQSLIQATRAGDDPRSTMLESMAAFAAEQLEASGEALDIMAQHSAFYRRLAEGSLDHADGPDREHWFDRLEAELDNLRAAIDRCTQDGRLNDGLAIAAAMRLFWIERNHGAEGLRILVALTESAAAQKAPAFPAAADAAAGIAHRLGDDETARWMAKLAPLHTTLAG